MNFASRYLPFVAFLVIGLAAFLALMQHWGLAWAPALLGGFDLGAAAFLAMLVHRFVVDDSTRMRSRAAANDVDHWVVLSFGLIIVVVIVSSVWLELTGADNGSKFTILLSTGTLIMAWFFANTLFSLHYAHIWYLKGEPGPDGAHSDHGGLDFPGNTPEPDYWDFSYFSFVLAMTFQVSDVQVTSKRMRRLALMHGLIAFFFNIAVIAVSVNLVSNALKPGETTEAGRPA